MKFLIYIGLISLFFVGCVQQVEFTSDDDKIIVTPSEVVHLSNEKIIPMKNGSNYFFSSRINNFGLYTSYSVRFIDTLTNNDLKWITQTNKFHNENDIKTLLNGSSALKKMYSKDVVELDFDKINADDGYCIKTPDHFMLKLKQGNMLCYIDAEGKWDIDIDKTIEVVLKHFEELSRTSISQ